MDQAASCGGRSRKSNSIAKGHHPGGAGAAVPAASALTRSCRTADHHNFQAIGGASARWPFRNDAPSSSPPHRRDLLYNRTTRRGPGSARKRHAGDRFRWRSRPSNDNIGVRGLPEAALSATATSAIGVYRSNTAGSTAEVHWATQFDARPISSIVVDPTDQNTCSPPRARRGWRQAHQPPVDLDVPESGSPSDGGAHLEP